MQGASELALHWLDCAAKQKHIGACTAYGRELLKKCDSRPLGCSHSLQLTEHRHGVCHSAHSAKPGCRQHLLCHAL